MNGDSKRTRSFLLKKSVLILIVILAVLMTAVVGTMAWLRYVRSLQTVTQIVVTDLSLKGPNDHTIAIDLNNIDVSQKGSECYVFGVRSNNVDKYWIQLGYTTNLNLTYTIYPAKKENASESGSGNTNGNLQIEDSLFVRGNPLNEGSPIRLNNVKKTDDTYQGFTRVQENADPLYWQYGPIDIKKHDTHYFILEISWSKQDNNKETDMIYLTVGTGGIGGSENSSGGSQ